MPADSEKRKFQRKISNNSDLVKILKNFKKNESPEKDEKANKQ